MNDRLPELENFKAIEAEPEKPEQWWKRYYSYFFFMILCMAFFAGGEFFRQTGFIGKKPYHLRSPSYTVAESNEIIYHRTIGAAGLGMVVGVIAGFIAENSRKK